MLEVVLRSCLRTPEGLQNIKENKTAECGAQYQLDKVCMLYTGQGTSTRAFGGWLGPCRGGKGRIA